MRFDYQNWKSFLRTGWGFDVKEFKFLNSLTSNPQPVRRNFFQFW